LRLPNGVHRESLAVIRTLLGGIFALGALGAGAELLLLEHTEDAWQTMPLFLLAASLLATAWHAISRGMPSLQILRLTMGLLVLGGISGLVLHYRSNVEFELEMYPSLGGLQLFRQAMSGAIPTLAPGALIQLGLIGLTYGYLDTYALKQVQHQENAR
jgi:hypothetical protein